MTDPQPDLVPVPQLPIDHPDSIGASFPDYDQELAILNEYFVPAWETIMRGGTGALYTVRGDFPQFADMLRERFADRVQAGGDGARQAIFLFYGPPPFDYARLNPSADANNDSAYDTASGVHVALNKDTGIVSYTAAPDLYIVGDLVKHREYVFSRIDAVLNG